MAEPVYIGHELKVLNHKIRRLAEGNMAPHPCGGMTEVQGRVLGSLTHHPGRDICQRDVEETFGITRATASKMLGDMERNGLILRCGVDYDARRKNLKLTEKAQRLSQEIQAGITEFEAVLTAGFAEEERRALLRLNKVMEAGEKAVISTIYGSKGVTIIHPDSTEENGFRYLDIESDLNLQLDPGDNVIRYDAAYNRDGLRVKILSPKGVRHGL